jgi:hypothetical protein
MAVALSAARDARQSLVGWTKRRGQITFVLLRRLAVVVRMQEAAEHSLRPSKLAG